MRSNFRIAGAIVFAVGLLLVRARFSASKAGSRSAM